MDTVIDHKIRDWVFIPIVFVMFMVFKKLFKKNKTKTKNKNKQLG